MPGCYGFELRGLDGARDLLLPVPDDWPALEVGWAARAGRAPVEDAIGPDRSELTLHEGWVTIEREPPRVTFRLPAPPPARDLVHPYLAPAAAVAARWAGRESFHAGAVLAGGGAWVVLGAKEGGKSTTLAWFALHGHTVLSDDLVVVDGASVLAGPRCVDLREPSARELGAGEPLGVVGIRERWRLRLGPAPAAAPLRGWITLAWGDEVAVEPLRGPERLLALLPFRSVQVEPRSPAALIDFGSLPVLRLRRPRRWEALGEGCGRLLEVLGS